MYQEKIKNYKQSNKNEFDLGFNSERLAYIPGYFSSYLDQSKLPNFTLFFVLSSSLFVRDSKDS